MAIERITATTSTTPTAAATPIDLSALSLGQSIDARVLAITSEGLARLQTSQGLLDAKMPVTVAPGDRMQLQVAGTSPDVTFRLTALTTRPDAAPERATLDPAVLKAMATLTQAVAATASQTGAPVQNPATPTASTQTAAVQLAATAAASAEAAAPLLDPRLAAQQAVAQIRTGLAAPLAAAVAMPAATSLVPPPIPLAAPLLPAAQAVPRPGPALAPVAAIAALGGLLVSADPAPQPQLATASAPPVPTAAVTGAPAEALASAVRSAVAGQASLAPLFADAARLAQVAPLSMPASLVVAIGRLLDGRLTVETAASATAIARQIALDGPTLEARLAAGTAPSPDALKPTLLGLAAELRAYLGSDATPLRRAEHTLPPTRGGDPVGQPPVEASDSRDSQTLARMLLADTDGALDRMRLLQYASLPDHAGTAAGQARDPVNPAHWALEMPIRLGQETAIAAFTIDRDGSGDGTEAGGKRWQVRFGMDVEPLGAVNAHIVLVGDRVSLTLRAERHAAIETFRNAMPALRDALTAADLDVTELRLLEGIDQPPPGRPGLALDRSA